MNSSTTEQPPTSPDESSSSVSDLTNSNGKLSAGSLESEVDLTQQNSSLKFRVKAPEKVQQVKEFASVSSASLNQNVKKTFRKIKKVGSIVLEKTADYMEKRKNSK